MGKIITFFGGDNKTGTSMIALSIAEYLGEKKKKTLFVQCNGKRDISRNSGNNKGLDDIKANILSGKVSKEDIEEIIYKEKTYSIIWGVKNPYSSKFYPDYTAITICSLIRDEYDFIILDGGSDINSGLGISSLTAADLIFFVITQGRKGLERYVYMKEQILRPLGIKGKIVINQYIKEPALYRKGEIEKLCLEENSFIVPYIEYGLQMEMEDKTLMTFPKYKKKIEKIGLVIEGGENRKFGEGILYRRVHE